MPLSAANASTQSVDLAGCASSSTTASGCLSMPIENGASGAEAASAQFSPGSDTAETPGHAEVAGLAELDGQLNRFCDRLPIAVERSEGRLVEHLKLRGTRSSRFAANFGPGPGALQARHGQG